MDLCLCSHNNKDLSINSIYKTSIDDLLDELLVNILSRLPLKTLVQSTCVCKLWNSIINAAYFVSAHLRRSRADPSNYYTFLARHHSSSVIVFSDNSFAICHPDFKFPFETQSTYVELLGACNGLICVTDSDSKQRGRHIYLVNPFIQKFKKLDVESSYYADLIGEPRKDVNTGFGETITNVNVGFGYSEVENDYKVLRIIMIIKITRRGVNEICYELTSKVEIYSLNSGKWKALDSSIAIKDNGKLKVQDIVVAPLISPVFVQGCLYWFSEDFPSMDEYILCFDLRDELFRRIEFPKTYSQLYSTWDKYILVKNGSLAIVLCCEHFERDSAFKNICLLVLEHKFDEQIQWKEFNYKCAAFETHHCMGFGAMGLNGGERLLFVSYFGSLVAVDLDNSCEIKSLVMDFSEKIIIQENIKVFESLVSFSD